MSLLVSKDISGLMSLQRSVSVYIAFLALFLFGASLFLISSPITSSIHEYMVGIHSPTIQDFVNSTVSKVHQDDQDHHIGNGHENISSVPSPSVSKENIDEKGQVAVAPPSKLDSRNNISGDCDLYHGRWVHDPDGPLYTNKTCPIITQMQNCQGNGRPDRDYENWRWKPDQCDLPRFDPRKFLQLMQGKTLAFIGDSVARNQMESLLCILWQVETPKNRGNRLMHRWTFPSTSTTIARIWSSWLVHHTNDPIEGAGADVDKLHLDMPDEFFMEHIPKFDVIVLSSGHWFAKKSVYLLNSTVIGGQLWNPPTSMEQSMKVNHMEAYRISVETALTAIARQPNYAGLTIVRTYSPDHYEGGEWNTGGSCTGKSKPAQRVVENGFTNGMHQRQVASFWNSMQKTGAAARFRLMDITEGFGLRHDGHPGPYRSPDPNKITKRGRGGRPPSQDCLHWCMPGPVDTWNELVLEIIRREFDHANDPIPQLQH
ncbi:trichome birefringence-like protein (DUF828) isoform X1 [Wolffia australiana]